MFKSLPSGDLEYLNNQTKETMAKFDEAVKWANDRLKAFPGDPWAEENYGRSLRMFRKKVEAMQTVQKLLKKYALRTQSLSKATNLLVERAISNLPNVSRATHGATAITAGKVALGLPGATTALLTGASVLQNRALARVKQNARSYKCPFGDPSEYGEISYCIPQPHSGSKSAQKTQKTTK